MQNHKSIQFVYKVQFNRFHSKDAPSNYVKHVEGNSYKCLCISVALPNSCPAKIGQERGRGDEAEWVAYWKLLPTAANPLGILSLCCLAGWLADCLLHVALFSSAFCLLLPCSHPFPACSSLFPVFPFRHQCCFYLWFPFCLLIPAYSFTSSLSPPLLHPCLQPSLC